MAGTMDFKLMKRKDLQELCKKHGIPANSTTSSMIESLELLFQIPKVVKRKGCLKGSNGSIGEGLGIGGQKKVTFVLEEEDEQVENLGSGGHRVGKTSRRSSNIRGTAGENFQEGENLDNVKPPQVRSLRSRLVVVGGVEGLKQKKKLRKIKVGGVVTEMIRRSTQTSSDGGPKLNPKRNRSRPKRYRAD